MRRKSILSMALVAMLSVLFMLAQAPVVKASSYQNSYAGFFDYLAKNRHLSRRVRANADKAEKIVTGKSNRPKWYAKAVKLGANGDASSLADLKTSLHFLDQINSARRANHKKSIGIGLVPTAYSVLNADYQKLVGMGHSGLLVPSSFSSENIAGDPNNPIGQWTEEASIWKKMVSRHPSWKYAINDSYKFYKTHPSDYEKVGHYLNLINPSIKSFGLARLGSSGETVMDNASLRADMSTGKFKQLVAEYEKYLQNPTKSTKKVVKHAFNVRASVKGRHNNKVRVYSQSGHFIKRYVLGGHTYRFNAQRRIHGKTYYKLAGKNQWVLASKLTVKH